MISLADWTGEPSILHGDCIILHGAVQPPFQNVSKYRLYLKLVSRACAGVVCSGTYFSKLPSIHVS